jgi:NAD(P)-dependent dehydrogenase (short-subunit alcohol dehydrogenase family)
LPSSQAAAAEWDSPQQNSSLPRGAYVYITGRREKELDAAVTKIGKNIAAVQGDVSNLEDLDRLYAKIAEDKGRVDVVFANAGIGSQRAPLGSITEEQIDRTFNVNVRGPIFTVQKALPLMHDGASIILNASSASIKGIGSLSVYAASKAAVRSLARSWTTDLKDRSIRVNAISPGYTETSIFETLDWTKEQFEEIKAGITKTIPLGRWAHSEEIAKAAVFVGSEESGYVAGIELFVDGGAVQV